MGGRQYLNKTNPAAHQGDANKKGRKSRIRSLCRDEVTAVATSNRTCSTSLFTQESPTHNLAASESPACGIKETSGGETESCSNIKTLREETGSYTNNRIPIKNTEICNGINNNNYNNQTPVEESESYDNNQTPIEETESCDNNNQTSREEAESYDNQTPREEAESYDNQTLRDEAESYDNNQTPKGEAESYDNQTPREETEDFRTPTEETETSSNNQTSIEATEVSSNNQTSREKTEVYRNNQASRDETEVSSNNQTSREETEVSSNNQTSREETEVHNNPTPREEIDAYSNSRISRGEAEAYPNNYIPSERRVACSAILMTYEGNHCLADIFTALLAQAAHGTDCCFSLNMPTYRGVIGQSFSKRRRTETSEFPVVLKKCSIVLVDCLSVDFLRFSPELFGEYSPKSNVRRKWSKRKRPTPEFPSCKRVSLRRKSFKTLNTNKSSTSEPARCNNLSSPNSAKKLPEKDIISGSSNKAEGTIVLDYSDGNICRDLSNENNIKSLVSVLSEDCSAYSKGHASRPNSDSRVESEAITTSSMPDENSQKIPKLYQKFLVVGSQKFSYFVTDTLMKLEKQQKVQQHLERNVPGASPEINELLELRNKNHSRRWSDKVIQCDITDADIDKIIKDCYKTFSHKNVTNEEVKVVYEDGVKMYGCNRCRRKFGLVWEMYKHRWTHYDLRPFQCPFCERNYRHSTGLRHHLYTHSPRRDHFCAECGLDFRRKNDLANHMITHLPDERVKCTQPGCNKVFRTRQRMIVHRKTHSLEKSFLCKVCGLGFRNKSYLVKHSRVHNDDRPFKCDQCDASYRLYFGLKMHKMRHLGMKPFICSVCFSAFPYTTSLRGHMRSQHPESSIT